MDKKTKETLSFLARMIVRQENNNGIPVPDMDRLKRIGDGTAFKDEQEEQIIDFDRNTYVKVKVRGRIFDCYLGIINQDILNTHQALKPMYTTDLRLIAVDHQPIMLGDAVND